MRWLIAFGEAKRSLPLLFHFCERLLVFVGSQVQCWFVAVNVAVKIKDVRAGEISPLHFYFVVNYFVVVHPIRLG